MNPFCNVCIESHTELTLSVRSDHNKNDPISISIPILCSSLASINSIIHNSSNAYITQRAIQLLGQFGGRSRSHLRVSPSLPVVRPSDGYQIILHGEVFTLDLILELTVQLLERNLIVESLENTTAKLAATLRIQKANIESVRTTRIAYKRIAMSLLQTAFLACLNGKAILQDPSLIYKLELALYGDSLSEGSDEVYETRKEENRVMALLLYGILLMCCDIEVKEEANQMLHNMITPLLLLLVAYTRKADNTCYIEFYQSKVLKEITSQRIGTSIQSLPYKYMPPMHTISATVLFEALVALLCRDFPCVADVVTDVMEWIAKAILQEVKDPMLGMVLQTSYLEFFFLISEKKIDNHNWRVHVCRLMNML